jgi:hypothetical protein
VPQVLPLGSPSRAEGGEYPALRRVTSIGRVRFGVSAREGLSTWVPGLLERGSYCAGYGSTIDGGGNRVRVVITHELAHQMAASFGTPTFPTCPPP